MRMTKEAKEAKEGKSKVLEVEKHIFKHKKIFYLERSYLYSVSRNRYNHKSVA